MKTRILTALAMALAMAAATAFAADVTWNGGGDGSSWSDGANWGGTAPGSGDRAIFPNQPSGLSTTVDASFGGTVQYVRIEQSTTSVTNAISLSRDLVISSNNGTGSGIQYAATITDPTMISWDINGNYLRFASSSGDSKHNYLYGTFILDTAGSRIGTPRFSGTGAGDFDTFHFGSGSNLAVVNVTANAQIGRITTGTTTSNALRLTTINVGAGSTVDISNNARLDFLNRTRSDGATLLAVNNAGTINIASGSTMGVVYTQVNNSDKTVNIGLTNQSTGTMNHDGTVAMSLTERGTATITNNGTWKAASGAVITGTVTNAGAGDGGTVVFNNNAAGVMQNASNGSLTYTPLTGAPYLNQTLTLNNYGVISPGAGHNGAGTSSVGTYSMTNINADFSGTSATLRVDLGGTSAGEYDVLTLTNGALTLTSDSKLELYYVNSYAPSIGDSWTILNYGSISGSFDLASNLSITGASGAAANPANYSMTYGANSAVLTLIPEPSSVALLIGGAALMKLRRRLRERLG